MKDDSLEKKDSEELYENNYDKQDGNKKQMSATLDWLISIVIAVVIALLIKTYIFEPTRIEGSSMNMTLQTEDRVIVDKIGMKFREIKRGDIIVMEYDTDHDYIKRIVGLPGETIQIIDGNVYINGELFDEPYAYGEYTETINGFEWNLEEDEYFVMGDNRQPGGSTDSRVFGPINLDKIQGVAKFRFWPLDSIGLIK